MDFTDAFRTYYTFIYRYISARIYSHHDVEELTAETFTRAWRRWTAFTDDGRGVGPWLTVIARNLILDMVKSSAYQRERTASGQCLDQVDTVDVAAHVVDTDEQRRVQTSVREHLAALPLAGRDVITLRFIDEHDNPTTAALLGCTVAAVKQRQVKAIRQLRAEYGVDHEKVRHAS